MEKLYFGGDYGEDHYTGSFFVDPAEYRQQKEQGAEAKDTPKKTRTCAGCLVEYVIEEHGEHIMTKVHQDYLAEVLPEFNKQLERLNKLALEANAGMSWFYEDDEDGEDLDGEDLDGEEIVNSGDNKNENENSADEDGGDVKNDNENGNENEEARGRWCPGGRGRPGGSKNKRKKEPINIYKNAAKKQREKYEK